MPCCASVERPLSRSRNTFQHEMPPRCVEVNAFKPHLPVAVSLALLSCSPETYSSTRDGNSEPSAAIVVFFYSHCAGANGKLGVTWTANINTHKLFNQYSSTVIYVFFAD